MVADTDILPGSDPWLRLARRARLLATLTLVWLGIEGTVGVIAGILAGSIALVAFGLDSAIDSRNLVARYRAHCRHAHAVPVARPRQAVDQRKAGISRHLWRGDAKHALRHSRSGGVGRSRREHPFWSVVA